MLCWQYIIHQCCLDMFVADDAGHLLGEVGRHLDIQSMPGSYAAQQRLTGFYMQAEDGIPQICRGGGGVDVRWGPLRSPFQFFGSNIQSLQASGNFRQRYVHPQLAAHFAFASVDNTLGLWYRIVVDHAW